MAGHSGEGPKTQGSFAAGVGCERRPPVDRGGLAFPVKVIGADQNLGVDRAVPRMSANKFDQHAFAFVCDMHDEAVSIAADVEDNTIVANEIGGPEDIPAVLRDEAADADRS